LKHTLVDSVFDADSKYVTSFETDRSRLMEICGIPVKKAKNDDPRITSFPMNFNNRSSSFIYFSSSFSLF
jgi:hypothetical protein